MKTLRPHEPLAIALVEAIHRGDHAALSALMAEHPAIATVRLGDGSGRESVLRVDCTGRIVRLYVISERLRGHRFPQST